MHAGACMSLSRRSWWVACLFPVASLWFSASRCYSLIDRRQIMVKPKLITTMIVSQISHPATSTYSIYDFLAAALPSTFLRPFHTSRYKMAKNPRWLIPLDLCLKYTYLYCFYKFYITMTRILQFYADFFCYGSTWT